MNTAPEPITIYIGTIAEELWVRSFELHRTGKTERATELLSRVLKAAHQDPRLQAVLADVVGNIAAKHAETQNRAGEATLLATLLDHPDKSVAEQAATLHGMLVPVDDAPAETEGR